MRTSISAAALAIVAIYATPANAQVSAENFGVVWLDVDYKGADPHLATQTLWLRRSDDGNKDHKVIEQLSIRTGRWKDSVKTQAFFPTQNWHSQFDTDAVPFTKTMLAELNNAIVQGTLGKSASLASNDGEQVEFKLTWDPKGHLDNAHNEKATLKGHLAMDASGQLSFAPADDLGRAVKPLMDVLLTQLQKTDKAQDEVQSAVVLFGQVSAADGKLTLSKTTWSCSIEGQQADTPSSAYVVSADTNASLRDLLTKLDGSFAAVRAVLTEPDKDHTVASAKVIGVFSGIGWKEPIENAPGGRAFENGGTLMNLASGEGEVSPGRVGDHRVAAEVTNIDPKSDYVEIRAPNRKGSLDPSKGYVKKTGVTVLVGPAVGKAFENIALESVESGTYKASETGGLGSKLPGQKP
jgi:hypothetical protein